MRKIFFERPYLALLPFLLLYLIIILVQDSGMLTGDEGRYLTFAENLLNGFYSPPPPEINLWNGPGFPLYLIPFVAFKVPLLIIRIFNAVLYFLALILFNKTLSHFIKKKRSLLFTFLFGCYYMPYKSLPHIISETLSIFLIAAVAYMAVNYFSSNLKYKSIKHTILFAMVLAYLALTKVLFGEVYLFAAMLFLLLYLVTKNPLYKRSFSLIILAFFFCIPYLIYTYSLSGKILYWSNAAGMSLYWMSNPVPGELGEWHNDSLNTSSLDQKSLQLLQLNHQAEYDEIHQYKGVQRDMKFKEMAWRNLKSHPIKIFKNWIANWSRMFFNYPESYVSLGTAKILNMLVNIPVLLLLAYSAFLTFKNKYQLPFAIKFLLIISGIYLFGSSLLSAYDRMFYIHAPVFGLWICYAFSFLKKNTNKTATVS